MPDANATQRRQRMIDAAPALAARLPLDGLTAETVAVEAGVTAEQFAAEFGTVENYFLELHRRFMDGILARLVADAGNLPPSLDRIARASAVQLDLCLEQRALRGWIAEARRRFPAVAEDIHQRNLRTAMMIGIELNSLKCRNARAVARLYCVMVLEAAQLEADAGAALPDVRQTLAAFLRTAMAAA